MLALILDVYVSKKGDYIKIHLLITGAFVIDLHTSSMERALQVGII
jgi:hypothetical protein